MMESKRKPKYESYLVVYTKPHSPRFTADLVPAICYLGPATAHSCPSAPALGYRDSEGMMS